MGRRARFFLVAGLLLTLAILSGCLRQEIHVAPPGSTSTAPPYADESAEASGPPIHRVLFLPGFNGDPLQYDRYWLAAVHRLPPRCEVYLVTGVDRFMGAREDKGPERPLRDLEDFLREQDIPLENLHLVAHSMGGLVARRFATLHPEALRQVFLLGTPNGGVRKIKLINFKGWCTPSGIGAFNEANPPRPGIRWYAVAGDRFRDRRGGAVWEGVPNDGVISVRSVLHFVELCGDSVSCEWEVFPVTHPTWNWGENLLESPRIINWVLDRIIADLDRDETPSGTAVSPEKADR